MRGDAGVCDSLVFTLWRLSFAAAVSCSVVSGQHQFAAVEKAVGKVVCRGPRGRGACYSPAVLVGRGLRKHLVTTRASG